MLANSFRCELLIGRHANLTITFESMSHKLLIHLSLLFPLRIHSDSTLSVQPMDNLASHTGIQEERPTASTISRKQLQQDRQEPALEVYYRRKLRECQGSDSIQRLNPRTSLDENRSVLEMSQPASSDSVESRATHETLEISYRRKLREYEGSDSVESLAAMDEYAWQETLQTLHKNVMLYLARKKDILTRLSITDSSEDSRKRKESQHHVKILQEESDK